MTEKRIAKMLGGYEVTIYPTALGDIAEVATRDGRRVKILGQHGDYDPCQHIITTGQAREVAAALIEIADGIDAGVESDPAR